MVSALGDKWIVKMLCHSLRRIVCASVFLKSQWNGDGDTETRMGMKYNLPIFYWRHDLPMPMLSPWSQHSGPDPSPLPLRTFSCPCIPWKWGQRGEGAGEEWNEDFLGLPGEWNVSSVSSFSMFLSSLLLPSFAAVALLILAIRNHTLFHPPHPAYFLSAQF